MSKVTDPALLAELEGNSTKVTDPALLAQLEGQPTPKPTLEQVLGPSDFTKAFASTPARMLKSGMQMVGAGEYVPEFVSRAAAEGDRSLPGRIAGDIAGTGGIKAGAGALVNTLQRLNAAKGILPAVGRTAEAAGYGATTGAITSPDEQANAAIWGVGGGALGHALARTFGGLVRPTPEARVLMDRGVALTPGQAAGPGTFINRVEQWAASNPIASTPVRAAQRRALNEGNVAAAQSVASLVDDKIKLGLPPSEAIEQTRAAISNAYDSALADMTVPVADLRQGLSDSFQSIAAENPMMTKKAFQHLRQYVINRVVGLVDNGVTHMDGKMLKQADSEIGQFIRNLSTSTNAADKTAVPAWRDLQNTLREIMATGARSPEQYQMLQNANAAYRQLLALEKAKLAGAEHFTPRQLARQVEKAGLENTDLGRVSRAMQGTLPNTVPDSGTAERLIANAIPALLVGGGAGAQSMGYDTVGAGLMAAGALGSRPGTRLMTGGFGWQPKAEAAIRALRRGIPATTRNPQADD